jgi:uncharacterized protein YjbI with pentapeptide repeats
MSKREVLELRNRWTSDLLVAINQRLKLPEKAVESPFGMTLTGLIDLRGLTVVEVVKNRKLLEVDFSFGSVEQAGMFAGVEAHRCAFLQFLFGSNLGYRFEHCSFAGAKMASESLRGRFSDCDFSLVNLMSSMGVEVKFDRCVFHQTNFRGSNFHRCIFDACQWHDCRFGVGSFYRSVFIGARPNEEELGNHIMDKVEFR